MTPPRNLTQTLLALGISACISTLPAQNPPAKSGQPGQTSGQPSSTDRQSTRSGGDTTSRSQAATPATAAQQGAAATTADKNRTAEAEMMVGPTDLKFMNETAQSGLMEVQAATLAEQKSQNDEVKKFAKQLLTDHSKANEELKALAAQKSVSLPTDMGPKHQEHISKLQNLSDAQFDKQFLKMEVDHHKKDIKVFQKHAEVSMDSHVKAFAEKTLPTLQQHLQTAQGLQQSGTRSRSAETSGTDSGRTSGNTSGTTGAGSSSDTKKQNQ